MNTYSSHAVANVLLDLATEEGKSLTNIQLQKLVFISHGYTLALEGYELYFHNTHAWQFGPVIPKLYKSLQKYGRDEVTESLEAEDTVDKGSVEHNIIKAVWNSYKHLTGGELSALTHQKNTPWYQIWEKEKFSVIPTNLISEHYKQKVNGD